MIKDRVNPYFVAELETGYVVIGDYQFFRGYTLFLAKQHKHELHEFDEDFRNRFLIEMSQVAGAVFRAFHPVKLNYELLGNKDSHVHWHLFPRHASDPQPTKPIWMIDPAIRSAESVKPSEEDLEVLKKELLIELRESALIL